MEKGYVTFGWLVRLIHRRWVSVSGASMQFSRPHAIWGILIGEEQIAGPKRER